MTHWTENAEIVKEPIGLSSSIFLTIKAGERGVLFKRFGGGFDKEIIYHPGFHMIAPWNSMYVYVAHAINK